MTVETLADLAVYLADFGVAVTYTQGANPPVQFKAIFDEPTVDSHSFHDAPAVIQSLPALMARTADLPAGAAKGDAVAVAGNAGAWIVRGIYPDGTGIARVDLELSA